MNTKDNKYQILKRIRPWREAFYYQKSVVLYQLTYVFCKRFLPAYGDRTVDQMVQAARMHVKLLNVARSSLQELIEEYKDYLLSRMLPIWSSTHPRYQGMQQFCKMHNKVEDYQKYFQKWTNEEMANTALTLCYQTDAMLHKTLLYLEKEFVEKGGIKERMHAVRTGYRQAQDAELASLRKEVPALRQEVARLRALLEKNGIKY